MIRFIQYSIACFTSAVVVAVTGQAGVAFTIIPNQPGATDNWKPTTSYNADGVFGITEVDRRLWTEPDLHTQLFNPLVRQGKPKAAPKLEN